MNIICIAFVTLLLLGCAQEDPKVDLVTRFWQAMDTNDAETLKQLLSDPQQAEFIASGNVAFAVESYEVLEPTSEGVNVNFVRHCYPDILVPTIIIDKNGTPKIDLIATLQAQMKRMAEVKATKKYCYEFQDQPMQGVINGEPWQAQHVRRQVFDFGAKKEEKLSIYSETCRQDNCFMVSTPSLLISNLDLSGDGGNFGNNNNITIYIPPSENLMISQGSYRVSSLSDGKSKLEISFKDDSGNSINGYIFYE